MSFWPKKRIFVAPSILDSTSNHLGARAQLFGPLGSGEAFPVMGYQNVCSSVVCQWRYH